MKLSEYNRISREYTGKASEIIRQLIIAGIAIIWLFKTTVNGKDVIAPFLVWPLLTLSLAALTDLSQYLLGGFLYDQFFLREEREVDKKLETNPATPVSKRPGENNVRKKIEDDPPAPVVERDPDVRVPMRYSNTLYGFYYTKAFLMLLSYVLISVFLVKHLQFSNSSSSGVNADKKAQQQQAIPPFYTGGKDTNVKNK